jgi:hypothetical protein
VLAPELGPDVTPLCSPNSGQAVWRPGPALTSDQLALHPQHSSRTQAIEHGPLSTSTPAGHRDFELGTLTFKQGEQLQQSPVSSDLIVCVIIMSLRYVRNSELTLLTLHYNVSVNGITQEQGQAVLIMGRTDVTRASG